jgi:hypothetical protein
VNDKERSKSWEDWTRYASGANANPCTMLKAVVAKCVMKVIVSFSLEKKERKERTAVVIQLHEQS